MSNPSAPAAKDAASKKRTRYTTVACNECKRRKIKCNGEKPCERCGNQNLDCVYESPLFQDSHEYRQMTTQIETLQNQVQELFTLVSELRAERHSSSVQQPSAPSVSGPAKPRDQSHDAEAMSSLPPALEPQGDTMEVDMSRQDGRIDFVPSTESSSARLMEGLDPLLAIRTGDLARLTATYTHQVHVIYPIIDLEELIWRLNKIRNLQQLLLTGEKQDEDGEDADDPNNILNDLDGLTCKMILAIAAHAREPDSGLAKRLYANVEHVYNNIDLPRDLQKRLTKDTASGSNWPGASLNRGIRLRAMESLWQFQQGNEKEALKTMRDNLEVHRRINLQFLSEATLSPKDAENSLRLGSALYSTYWRWTLLAGPIPRFDSTVEKIPPRRLDDGDEYDDQDMALLRDPFFEYGKLCSITAFAFERSGQELSALEATKPPWTKDNSVDHVHRWQGSFSTGLKSLACIRPHFLGSKTPEERVTLSVIYLHANALRIAICKYKRDGDRYQGPISELYESAKFATDSIQVLWHVHETCTTWTLHSFLYNNFLLHSGTWLYELLNDSVIRLTDEVKGSLRKTLKLLENHSNSWNKSRTLLQKLRESQSFGAI